jgi:hypothetical protein
LVKRSNEKLFVGIDEYDAPANPALFASDPDLYKRVTEFFSTCFFSVIKDAVTTNTVLKYWLTGVLPAFRDGISPLTATRIISNEADYHGICGLTHAEVRTITLACLGSEKLEEAMNTLQRWYNGYRFCRSADVMSLYNPQLVFAHLQDMQTRSPQNPKARDEIDAIHTGSILNAMPKEGDTSFLNMFLRASSGALVADVRFQFSSNEIRDRDSNPWVTMTLLYFFGVLSYGENLSCLAIPNYTMRRLVRMITFTEPEQSLTNSFFRFRSDSAIF